MPFGMDTQIFFSEGGGGSEKLFTTIGTGTYLTTDFSMVIRIAR